jgi:BNR repeat protein
MTLLLAALLLAGHAHAEGPGARSLDLFARDGVADVLVTVKAAGGLELVHQRSRDGGRTWSAPVRLPVGAGDLKGAHRGNDPQVAAHGERLVAVWTRPGTSAWGTGPLATALSADGGRTWSPGPNPADDGSTDGHGYADLAADAAGIFYMAWLDGRDGGQGLRGAVSRDGGRTWSRNATLDARTCECCWNRLAASESGTVAVLYRDKDPRDLAVAASTDAGTTWARRGTAGAFGWRFEGCPHVGGGIAFTRGGLAALAWTGDEDDAGLHAVRSEDGGATWSAPVRVGSKTAHRGDLASSGDVLAAAWDDPVAAKGQILGATSPDGGRTWSPARALASGGAAQPMVAAVGPGRFLAAWIETGPGGEARWRSAPLGRAD